MNANADTKQELIQLFRQSGPAHHQAYLATNGADPEWPLWYADYLHEPIDHRLPGQLTRSELVYFLVLAEKKRQAEVPSASWPEYYADLLLQLYDS